MRAKSTPIPAPEDLATEQLVAAVESAIGGIQERLANRAGIGQAAKWSVSDLNQLPGERPCTIFACWVHDPRDIGNNKQRQPAGM